MLLCASFIFVHTDIAEFAQKVTGSALFSDRFCVVSFTFNNMHI